VRLRSKRNIVGLIVIAIVVGAGVPAISCALEDKRFNQDIEDEDIRSSHLESDIELMWETTDGNPETGRVSTARAINAASRVFNTVELVGKSGAEVKALLGSPTKSNDSAYRGAAFWPIESRAMIYRFDNGNYGWQVNVYCEGDDQLVTKVEKLWIE